MQQTYAKNSNAIIFYYKNYPTLAMCLHCFPYCDKLSVYKIEDFIKNINTENEAESGLREGFEPFAKCYQS